MRGNGGRAFEQAGNGFPGLLVPGHAAVPADRDAEPEKPVVDPYAAPRGLLPEIVPLPKQRAQLGYVPVWSICIRPYVREIVNAQGMCIQYICLPFCRPCDARVDHAWHAEPCIQDAAVADACRFDHIMKPSRDIHGR